MTLIDKAEALRIVMDARADALDLKHIGTGLYETQPHSRRRPMTAPNLLPCPFCGGAARKWQDPSHSAAWFIGCDDGDRDCFGSIHWAETEAEAIAAWNRRAAPPDIDTFVLENSNE